MITAPAIPTWVEFLSAPDEKVLSGLIGKGIALSNRYLVQEVTSVRGELPQQPRKGWILVRVESSSPFTVEKLRASRNSVVAYYGVTEELHYTTADQRRELDERSRPELEPSDKTTAVLIPVKKSAEWWRLAQDERQRFFRPTSGYEGHIAVGARYVDRVYRKLYHSRHLPYASDHDFLTYFEFRDVDTPAFRTLLTELRDVNHNPEWRYVEREHEIWMTKLDNQRS